MSEEEVLWRTARWAFSHDRPGGSHDPRNWDCFIRALQKYIDVKVQEGVDRFHAKLITRRPKKRKRRNVPAPRNTDQK